MVFLDSTVVTVALPRIGRELPSLMFGVLEGHPPGHRLFFLKKRLMAAPA